ncbi:flavin monoamine oxidase family protein [Aspergillus melleus]|uniref:flavin monoamine oxidase family protein n=1 Tax=Aspergillus melleus TaxID=138277 RepID=UPI001E8D6192|nr:uncharacterized protein LDX57_001972 [Aspergillus melleus]KAH8424215.1 hypothetical protein LDX57_001972 [Aspergillus melleus]
MGGAWVHWTQPQVFAELQRYGLDKFDITTPSSKNGEVLVKRLRNESVRIETQKDQEATMADTTSAMMELLDFDGQGGRGVVAFPFDTRSSAAANPDYLAVDKLSIAERANQLANLNETQKEGVIELASSFFGISGEEASFLELLHMNSLCYFNDALVEEATMKYKISDGTSALALAMLNDFKGHRIMSAPVSAITQQPDGCMVTLSSGKQFLGSKVISTIPANVALSIHYDPPLSDVRQEGLSQGFTPGKIDKILATTSRNLKDGLSITCEGGDMPFLSGFADGVQLKDQSLITMLSNPDVDIDSSDSTIRLLDMLHPEGLDITSVRAHLWSKDPFSNGVMGCRKPGFVSKYWEELRKPHGDLFFCGSDWAEGWRGFISGAFEDSYRVTREILR